MPGMSFDFGFGLHIVAGTVHNMEIKFVEEGSRAGQLEVKFTVRTSGQEYSGGEYKSVSEFHKFWETGPENYKNRDGKEVLTDLGKIAKFIRDHSIVLVLYRQATDDGTPKMWSDKEGYAHTGFQGKILHIADLTPKFYREFLDSPEGQAMLEAKKSGSGTQGRPRMQQPQNNAPTQQQNAPAAQSQGAPNTKLVGSAWEDDD